MELDLTDSCSRRQIDRLRALKGTPTGCIGKAAGPAVNGVVASDCSVGREDAVVVEQIWSVFETVSTTWWEENANDV